MAKNKILEFLKKTPSWQRFTLSLIGIGILVGKWQWGVWHLYSLPLESYSSFTSITTNNDYVIGAIVIFMVTGKLIYDWKNTSISNIVTQAEIISEKIQEDRTEKIEETVKYYNLPPEEELIERYGDR